MRLSVLSRDNAVEYCTKAHKDESAIISISTPYYRYQNFPFKSEKNNVKDILFTKFADADAPNKNDVYGKIVSQEELISDKQAKEIVDFVKRNKDRYIIVHCDAGISRSSGVGAAILKYYTGDDSRIFENRWYMPNRLCYRKVLEAFYGT